MTEHSVSLQEVPLQESDRTDQPIAERSDLSTVISLNLPIDLAWAIEQQRQQSGQPTIEVICTLLRSALALPATPAESSQGRSELAQTFIPEGVELILARLSQVEALIPRLEALEGKLIAF